jgi:hypothetical protein
VRMKIDQNGLYENFGPWHQPFWQTNFFLVGVGCLSLLLISVLAWHLYKRLCAKGVAKKPWEIAQIELKALCARVHKNDTAFSAQDAYTTLTWILKKYLNARYQLELTAATDQELAPILLRVIEFPKPLMPELTALEHASVAAKFAHEKLLREQIEGDIERCIKIVQQTTPATQ